MSINFNFDTYKKILIVRFKEKDKTFFDPKQFKIFGKKKQIAKSTEENSERDAKTIMV